MNNTQYTNAIQQGQIQHLQTQNMIMMAQNSHQSSGGPDQPIWPMVIMVLVVCIFLFAAVWWSDRQERKMDKPFLSDFDNNILSRMYPDGKIVSLKEEKPKKKKANKKPLKIEKELGDVGSNVFVGCIDIKC